jgi:hypothetical protein
VPGRARRRCRQVIFAAGFGLLLTSGVYWSLSSRFISQIGIMIVSPHQRFQEEQPAHAPRLSGEGLLQPGRSGLSAAGVAGPHAAAAALISPP